MEGFVRRKKMEDLLALRGMIPIDYDWEPEEEAELQAVEEREHIAHVRSRHCRTCDG